MMVVMLMVVTAAALLVMIMVMMLMVVTAAAMLVMVVVVMVMLLLQLSQLSSQSCLTLHRLDQLLAGKLVPGGGHDGGIFVVLPDHGNRGIQLCLSSGVRTREDDGGGSLDLVIIELTKVLHVDLDLACVTYCHGIAQGHFLIGDLVHGADNIAELAHAGGLDDDSVRVILLDDLGQCLAKVAY